MTTDLLRTTLETIRDGANTYLENLDRRIDPWIVLSDLSVADRAPGGAIDDKIVMTVYNLEHETVTGTTYRAPATRDDAAPFSIVSPPLYLDVHLMFSANFPDSYASGLAALSRLIGYFQQTPVFNRDNAPGLDPAIEKISLEMENLGPVELGHVVAMHGGRYLPSVFYKLRMLPFTSAPAIARSFPLPGGGSGDR